MVTGPPGPGMGRGSVAVGLPPARHSRILFPQPTPDGSAPTRAMLPRMLRAPLLVLALTLSLVAPAAAQPCSSFFQPLRGALGVYELGWGPLRAQAHRVEFVPYALGIAAMVIVTRPANIAPLPIWTTTSGSCPQRDVDVLGWAWMHATPQPGDQVGLIGDLNGAFWRGPLDDLMVNPSGFRYYPVTMTPRLAQSSLGAMVLGPNGFHRAWLDLSAYLIAPTSGSW